MGGEICAKMVSNSPLQLGIGECSFIRSVLQYILSETKNPILINVISVYGPIFHFYFNTF